MISCKVLRCTANLDPCCITTLVGGQTRKVDLELIAYHLPVHCHVGPRGTGIGRQRQGQQWQPKPMKQISPKITHKTKWGWAKGVNMPALILGNEVGLAMVSKYRQSELDSSHRGCTSFERERLRAQCRSGA